MTARAISDYPPELNVPMDSVYGNFSSPLVLETQDMCVIREMFRKYVSPLANYESNFWFPEGDNYRRHLLIQTLAKKSLKAAILEMHGRTVNNKAFLLLHTSGVKEQERGKWILRLTLHRKPDAKQNL